MEQKDILKLFGLDHSKATKTEYSCDKCDKVFSEKYALNGHKAAHNQEVGQCKYCHEDFMKIKVHEPRCPKNPIHYKECKNCGKQLIKKYLSQLKGVDYCSNRCGVISRSMTYEECKQKLSEMKYLKELQGTSLRRVIINNGWDLDELTSHLIRVQHAPYTEEEVRKEALKYTKRADFQNKSNGQYSAAHRLGILDDVCKHMGKSLNEKQYTKKEILESSRKWNNQRDWLKNEPFIFRCASGYGKPNNSKEDKEFWKECISHMEYLFKPNGYWTHDKCKPIALSYNDRRIFHKEQQEVYKVIKKEGWEELLEHMIWTTLAGNTRYPIDHWEDLEKCKEEALKYKTRSEMLEHSHYCYSTILKNNWDDQCFKHMKRHAINKPRYIYVFIWEDLKLAYVGLSAYWKRRYNSHLRRKGGGGGGTIYKTIKETGIQPTFEIITKRPVKEENAARAEKKWQEHYESLGYEMLNKVKAGSLGGKRSVWTKSNIWKIVNQCSSMTEFYKKVNFNCIQSCRTMGIFDEIVEKLVVDSDWQRYAGGWTEENALEEAKKYKQARDLQKKCPGAYKFLYRNNLVKKAYPKTLAEQRSEKRNNFENCKQEALKYKTRSEFSKGSRHYYRAACAHGWMDQICSHMKRYKTPVYWTYERCKEAAKECKTNGEFRKKYKGAHNASYDQGWMKEFFLIDGRSVRSKESYSRSWYYENCKEEAEKYKHRSEFQKKCSGGFKAAKREGWLNEFFPQVK